MSSLELGFRCGWADAAGLYIRLHLQAANHCLVVVGADTASSDVSFGLHDLFSFFYRKPLYFRSPTYKA
jgi:hypothetical protein